jgi:trehalose 6-phosphate phosphatase
VHDPAAAAAAIRDRREGRRLLICCDFDGTLVEFQPDPAAVVLPDDRRRMLTRLLERPDVSLALVSGRRLSDVRERTGLSDPAWFAGLHGLEIEGGGERFVHPQVAEARALVQGIASTLAPRVEGRAGAFIEDKGLSVALHFREASPEVQAEVASAFEQVTRPAIETGRLRVMRGAAVLELLPNIPWNKGDAVRWIHERVRRQHGAVLPVYLGDDVTDQDAFRELEGQGIRVAASDRVTGGDFSVDGPAGIAILLGALAAGR